MRTYLAFAFSILTALGIGAAPALSQTHRGQMDTDGILSPGEIPNPRIRYGNRPYAGGGYAHADKHWDHDHDDRYSWQDRGRWDSKWERPTYADPLGGSFYNGVKTGRISRDEERELRDAAQDLRRREDEYRRDGRLSPRERDDLDDRQDDLRKKLDHELYDGEKRRW